MVEKKVEAVPHPDNHERHEVRRIWSAIPSQRFRSDKMVMTAEEFIKKFPGWCAS